MALKEDKQSMLATVSLLSASTGLLDVLAIPSNITPDWLVPSALVLDTVPSTEKTLYVTWRDQEVPVYSLVGNEATPTHIMILESTSDIYRIGLQVEGSAIDHQMRISELKDVDDPIDNQFSLQAVRLEDELHIVPDLDKLSSRLVDLD